MDTNKETEPLIGRIGERSPRRPSESGDDEFSNDEILHDYAGIDLKLVWNILQTAIPKLALQIAELK